jgi:hypothetical protein
VGRINYFAKTANLWAGNGEATAHEFTHSWDTNFFSRDNPHCLEAEYTDRFKACLQQGGTTWLDLNNGKLFDNRCDGQVIFHYKQGTSPTSADSEYIEIRQHPEPLQ